MSTLIHRCPACGKRLRSAEGVVHHIKDRHKRSVSRHLAAFRDGKGSEPKPEREDSMASLFIDAEMNRAMGIPNDPWIAEMLP